MIQYAFIFTGRSGSGKGTQIRLLGEKLKEKYPNTEQLFFTAGDNIREISEGSSYTSILAKKILNTGKLFPDFLALWALGNDFVSGIRGDQILLVDGFTRTKIQSEVFNSAMDFYGYEKKFIINIEISSEESSRRLLLRGREDDNDLAIKKRMDWYDQYTVEAIDFFRHEDDYEVVDIDGNQPIEKVHADIVEKLSVFK